jgi:hypothetical protein
MTCRELRQSFENLLRPDVELSDETEHLAHCPECARFVEARRELGAGLRVIRECVQEPSAALDAAVLAKYRGKIRGGSALRRSAKRRRIAVASWSAIAAVVALAAALAIHSLRKVDTSTARTESVQRLSVSQSAQPMKAANSIPSRDTVAPLKRKRPRFAQVHHPTPSVAAAETAESADFRSLMYCDPLSCGGVMQLIRVQLPSSAAAFEPAGISENGMIYADVLVGPDGVARGIRVVP